MQPLKKQDQFLVGLTLFSMFFGAGNLIFPPLLGAQSGTSIWLALLGFAISAVGLPVLGVIAVAKSGGLPNLAMRVGKHFSWWFSLLIYLSIGPGLAIPRTASTSFEMAVTPFFPEIGSWGIVAYSAVFFIVAMLVSFRPEKLTDRLGKILAPTLLVLIGVIVVGCVLNPPASFSAPTGSYTSGVLAQGFVDGYLTMDTIAALNYGIVIALNIQNRGISDSSSIVKGTVRAGWIAGVVLVVLYSVLGYVGAVTGPAMEQYHNGANILSYLVRFLYGAPGSILLGLVFIIACLNSCIGLFSSCSEYFYKLFPRISYRGWVVIFGIISFGISILGLDAILTISIPVLNVLYPLSIVLIAMGLTHSVWEKAPICYPVTILVTGAFSVVYALNLAGLSLPVVGQALTKIPLYQEGLCWLLPAVLACLVGFIVSKLKPVSSKH